MGIRTTGGHRRDLDGMSRRGPDSALSDGDVLFARTTPAHKMRIVEPCRPGRDRGDDRRRRERRARAQARRYRRGDGHSAAPMSPRRPPISSFSTTTSPPSSRHPEGRRQFANIRKFVRYLLGSNSAEVIALAVNLVIGGPLVLLPVHILWINLLTDGVSAVALGLEAGRARADVRAAHGAGCAGPDQGGPVVLAAFGLYMAAVCLAMFYALSTRTRRWRGPWPSPRSSPARKSPSSPSARHRHSALRLGLLSNPWLLVAVVACSACRRWRSTGRRWQVLLGTVPLGIDHLALVAAAAVPVIFGPTLAKAHPVTASARVLTQSQVMSRSSPGIP
jgi:Ca2+-transporting ATPase